MDRDLPNPCPFYVPFRQRWYPTRCGMVAPTRGPLPFPFAGGKWIEFHPTLSPFIFSFDTDGIQSMERWPGYNQNRQISKNDSEAETGGASIFSLLSYFCTMFIVFLLSLFFLWFPCAIENYLYVTFLSYISFPYLAEVIYCIIGCPKRKFGVRFTQYFL